MKIAENEEGADGTAHRQEHIPLSIPDIALCCEESIGVLTDSERDPPFEEFIERADGEGE